MTEGCYRWCGWCCNLRYPLCPRCQLCCECCRCGPPCMPPFCAMPQLPCMGPTPPPSRIIREQVMVPYPCPYPVYCGPPPPCDPCNYPAPCYPYPTPCNPYQAPCNPYPAPCNPYPAPSYSPCNYPVPCCDPCNYPVSVPPYAGLPRTRPAGLCCEEPCSSPIYECGLPCPYPRLKRIFKPGQSVIPGYRGHVPGLKFHSAGRSFGQATRDTCCLMSKWDQCCPQLPCRIFEQ